MRSGGAGLLPAPQTLQLAVDVLLLAEALQQGDQVQQLRVRHVVEPRLHGDLRVEAVELITRLAWNWQLQRCAVGEGDERERGAK